MAWLLVAAIAVPGAWLDLWLWRHPATAPHWHDTTRHTLPLHVTLLLDGRVVAQAVLNHLNPPPHA